MDLIKVAEEAFATLFGITAGRGRVMSYVVLERQTIFN